MEEWMLACRSFGVFLARCPVAVEGVVHCAFEFGGGMMAVEAALDGVAEG